MSYRVGFGNPFTLDAIEAARRQQFQESHRRPEPPIEPAQKVGRTATSDIASSVTTTITTDISYSRLDGLFRASGLEARGPEKWNAILNESANALEMTDGDRLVGFARMTESVDGESCTFHDAVIRPEYRDAGLLSDMQRHAQSIIVAKQYSRALIEAVPGSEEMYEHLGWKPKVIGEISLQGGDGAVVSGQVIA